ncbi:hypothetical protein R1flu_021822 [Riccia fluitans]|uniref:BTB domain-containing protein n=1 Tax=Riccia fluitans TaxID=41844 RepID=A0ABD1ZTG6_9MARC
MEVSADMRVCLGVMKESWYPNDKVNLFKQLVEQLKGMVNNAEFSDVAFLCEDGVKVHACRMFLAARSSVCRKMLQNGMAESKSDVIRLPAVASSTLIEVFKFRGVFPKTYHHTGREFISKARLERYGGCSGCVTIFLAGRLGEHGSEKVFI